MKSKSTLLRDSTVRNAKPGSAAYKLKDTAGLHLLVLPSGKKHWRLRYRIAGKENLYAIGTYPSVSLAEARKLREEARRLVKEGIHPSHARQAKRLEVATEAGNTFESIAKEWIAQNKAQWTDYYLHQVETMLRKDAFPDIGSLPIRQVTAAHILKILRTISTRKARGNKRGAPTVALLIRQWCSAIFRFAVATLRAEGDPAAALKGAITRPKVRHKNAFDPKSIADFVKRLDNAPCTPPIQIALHLLLLTFVRPCELRGARWDEIDFEKKLWIVPAERMKMREKHMVPLSSQAVALLKRLQAMDGRHPLLFPNTRSRDKSMSPTTLNRCLERMGYSGFFSAHAFRATASTNLNELGWKSEIVEVQLAHQERNKSRKAYNHAKHLPERTAMMQAWADYIDGLGNTDNVVAGGFGSRAAAA